MVDFDLSPEQKLLKDTAKDFADREIMPGARDRDRNATFPNDIIAKLGALGFLGPLVPEQYGGMGADFMSEAIIFEEIGRADSSVRTTLSVQISLCEAPILKYGNEEQKRKYLPKLASGEWLGCFGLTEPQAGSDAANQQTTCRRDGDHWILNGHKMWISNGTKSKVAIIFAQGDPSKKHRGISAFLVENDTPGFESFEIHGKLGLRSSATAELKLTDVRVHDSQRLGEIGQGFNIAMYALDNGRFGVASGCVGIIQGCVDASVKYAQERYAFNKPIASFQLVQELIADMYLDLEAARLLVYRAGARKNTGDPAHIETSLAKWYASEAAVRAALNTIQVHGGYGYSDEYPGERYLRDAKVATLYEGTTQIQKLIIGRHLTGISAFV
ncbi:MAG: acyl-CoA dehydrogenase family protein [Chloroflexi bacterium]|nr:acyl-CoA dehydrogenase family protein [Chloroflexota bacterium]